MTQDIDTWLVEHETELVKAVPDLLSDDSSVVAAALTGLIGTALVGPSAGAVTASVTRKLMKWAEVNSATTRLIRADQAEARVSARSHAVQNVVLWIRDTIVAEVRSAEAFEHTQTRAILTKQHEVTAEALTQILERLPAVARAGAANTEKLSSQLDVTRGLLVAHDPAAALGQLVALESLVADASSQVRCRWFCQRGIAYFELGELANSIRAFEAAFAMYPLA